MKLMTAIFFCKINNNLVQRYPNLFETRTTFIKTKKFYTWQACFSGRVMDYKFTSTQLTDDNMLLSVNYSLYIDEQLE